MSMANWKVHVIDPVVDEESEEDSINIYSARMDELIAISFISQMALDAFKAAINKLVVK